MWNLYIEAYGSVALSLVIIMLKGINIFGMKYVRSSIYVTFKKQMISLCAVYDL